MGQKYSGVAVSGFNSVPPSDDASQTEANKVKWATHVNKIGTPLNNAIAQIDAALTIAFSEEAQLKTAGYTTTLADNDKLLEVTGTNTMLLLDASTAAAGYEVAVVNAGTGVVTVGRATAGNFINGVAQNWVLNVGEGASFRVNSTTNGYDVVSTAAPPYSFPTSSGGGLAYQVTFVPAISAYHAGLALTFVTNTVNTGAMTLAVNGLAAKAVVKEGGAALVAGDLPSGIIAHVIYSGSEFRLNRTTASSITGFPAAITGTAATLRTQIPIVAQIQDGGGFDWGGSSGGTANAHTITLTPAITAYVTGMLIRYLAANGANTTAVTVNVNGVGVKGIVKEGGAALAAGDIPAGAIVRATYDGTDFRLHR